ncbi:MAG TPA: hypothetical protein VN687_01105 [Blastocatellia bacterium]|nr:hypothetical protein [Blastocatellia bacterium]
MNLSLGKFASLVVYAALIVLLIVAIAYVLYLLRAGFWISAGVWLAFGLLWIQAKAKCIWLNDLDEGRLSRADLGSMHIHIVRVESGLTRRQGIMLISFFSLWIFLIVAALLWWQSRVYLLLPMAPIPLAILFNRLEKRWGVLSETARAGDE